MRIDGASDTTQPKAWLGRLVRRFSRSCARRAAEHRERRRMAWEFLGLADQDRDRILADAGLAPAELSAFIAHAPASGTLMTRMVKRLGVEAELRETRGALREVRRICALCDVQRRCRRWLDAGTDRAGYRAFCPNAETFDRLKT